MGAAHDGSPIVVRRTPRSLPVAPAREIGWRFAPSRLPHFPRMKPNEAHLDSCYPALSPALEQASSPRGDRRHA